MRQFLVSGLFVAALAAGWSIAPRAQAVPDPPRKLDLKFNDGKVTLVAQGVTVREVMAEWARQCGCVVQGSERLTGGAFRLPVEFTDQPESVVLESLLRSAGGYLLGPKAPGSRGGSIYGSLTIFPVTRGTTSPTYGSSAPIAAPLVTSPVDDEIPPVVPVPNPQTPGQTSQTPGQSTPPVPGSGTPGRPGGPAVPIVPAGPGRSGDPGSAGSLL
jgi:hypothetical protein